MPLSETDLKQIKAEAKEWTKNFGTPHLEEEAYTVGATAQAEKYQSEVRRLSGELEACEQLASIRSTLITNLNDLLASRDSELRELRGR